MPLLGMGHTSQPLTQPSRLSTTGGAKVENEDTIGGQLWGPEWGGLFRHFLPGGLLGGGGTNGKGRIEAHVI